MTDNPRLRTLLRDLGEDAGLDSVPVPAVVRQATRMRWLRRGQATTAVSLLAVVLATTMTSRGGSETSGLVVRPEPTVTESPGGTPLPDRSAQPEASDPSATPHSGTAAGPTVEPTAGPTTGTTSSPSPTESPSAEYSPATTPPQPKYCNLVADQTGDAGPLPAESLDIVRGDIATGKAKLVAVVQVKSLTAGDAHPEGVTWAFGWTIDQRDYVLTAFRDPGGKVTGTLTMTGEQSQTVTATVDTGQSQVVWTVPRTSIPDLKKTGRTLRQLHAYTSRGSTGPENAVDTADSTATYPDRAPSCVSAR